jgi:ABC-type glycerol-3-phosphate transport system substrate-binding protein
MSKFQIILLSVFIVFIIIGVVAFATFKGSGSSSQALSMTVWGTFPADIIEKYVANINMTLAQPITVQYKQESAAKFSQDFVKALAVGAGPDAILIPSDILLSQENKLTPIPYATFPLGTFENTYIQEANIYVSSSGILAIPFTVDPLVMYWNRDTFNAAGIATYPKYWDEFDSLVQKLTVKDANGNVRKSAVALGDFTTVVNAREILGTLFMQLGNNVTAIGKDGTLQSTIGINTSNSITTALQFFTKFVDPTNADYSWNRGMQDSKTAFLSGTLATYFGFASELSDIQTKNPNLNFDVAPLPQLRTGGVKATYGKLYGFSLVRASSNANTAYQVISILTQPANLSTLSQTMYLPPVRTDLIAQGSTDQYISIFDQAALVGKTWLDADPVQSGQIFGNLVDSITSGRENANQAIQDAGNQYNALLQQATQ